MTAAVKPSAASRPVDAARLAASRILHAVLEEGAYANLSSIRLLERTELESVDRRFASALVYGTLSRIYSIDWLLAKVSHQPLASLDPWLRTVLRLGVWQLRWSRSIPASAAIDESVRLAGWLVNRGAGGYANAALRRLSRETIELPAGNPPVFFSLSPEIYGYLRKWYGVDEAALLAESFLRDDIQVTARVNCRRSSPEQLIPELMASGIGAGPGLYCPEALRLDLHGRSVRSLPAWQRGDLTIQDEAAMLAAQAVSAEPGQTIIDLCAAPGGKTCHLAELTGNRSRILAFDSNPERLKLVLENAARLGHDNIECRQGDAAGAGMDLSLAGTADRVIADVPCSGLGLLGRKPEIRLNMTHEKMTGLYPLQAAILEYAATLVRAGGILVYSTCTINPAENIERIRSFLLEHPGKFSLDPLTPHLPVSLTCLPDLSGPAAEGWLQLLPHRHGLDGFFIARLRRT